MCPSSWGGVFAFIPWRSGLSQSDVLLLSRRRPALDAGLSEEVEAAVVESVAGTDGLRRARGQGHLPLGQQALLLPLEAKSQGGRVQRLLLGISSVLLGGLCGGQEKRGGQPWGLPYRSEVGRPSACPEAKSSFGRAKETASVSGLRHWTPSPQKRRWKLSNFTTYGQTQP